MALLAAVLLALLLMGCEPAGCIYPLYNSKDTASDDRLLGTWQPVAGDTDRADQDQRWNFVHSKDDNFYDFTLGAIGRNGGLAAKVRLVGIGNYHSGRTAPDL